MIERMIREGEEIPVRWRTCPWCEGKKVVGRMAFGEMPGHVSVLGQKVQVIGTMLDVCCKFCEGFGMIPADLSQADRWKQIRHEKEKRERDA